MNRKQVEVFNRKFERAKEILREHPDASYKFIGEQLNEKPDTVYQWFHREKKRAEAPPPSGNNVTAEDMVMALVNKINKQSDTIKTLEQEIISLKKTINELTLSKQSLFIQVQDALGRRE